MVSLQTNFDGLEWQIKGVLPTDKDLASADALLKRAIDTDTLAHPIRLTAASCGRGMVWGRADDGN
jgi:hypothetical protein